MGARGAGMGVGVVLLAGCRPGAPPLANVLVIVADDLGRHSLDVYEPGAPPTPALDALAARSRVFDLAWSTPTCSPARASMLTGRHPSRHGLTAILRSETADELPLAEVTIAEHLDAAPRRWATSAVGKWHLATHGSPSSTGHARAQGFDWWSGSLGNLGTDPHLPDPEPRTYTRWEKVLPDGSTVLSTVFATLDTTDDAIARAATMDEPWLLWVAYNAPHAPLEPPPRALATTPEGADDDALYDANIVALDAEIGRLLREIDPEVLARTTVVFLGDNGAPRFAERKSKGTMFEGGLGIPLLVAGPAVAEPGHTRALVHVVDLFPTIAELAGVRGPPRRPGCRGEVVPIDGLSLVPLLADANAPWGREVLTSEWAYPNFDPDPFHVKRAARTERYKMVSSVNRNTGLDRHTFYDLDQDPKERRPLGEATRSPEAAEAHHLLEAWMEPPEVAR